MCAILQLVSALLKTLSAPSSLQFCWSAVFPYLVGQRSPTSWGIMVGHLGLSFVVCSVLMIILAAGLFWVTQ